MWRSVHGEYEGIRAAINFRAGRLTSAFVTA